MIARARPEKRGDESIQQKFVGMLPAIGQYARIAFRQLTPEAREEAVQEVTASAFIAFSRLVERGREQLAFPTVLARYAVAQYFDGRRVATRLCIRDVMSPFAHRKNRVVLERLDHFDAEEQAWREAVLEDGRTPVVDQACFRIDFPDWLSRLPARCRRVAQLLAAGHSTSEVACRCRLSQGRVSQLRRELHDAWQQFHGESHHASQTAVTC